MPYTPITPLPPAPSRQDDGNTFSAKADAFVAAQDQFVTETNASGSYIDGVGTQVDLDKTAAETAATNAGISETNSATSETNSATSAAESEAWANAPEDSIVSGGEYSAKHYAAKAAGSVSSIPAGTINDSIISPTTAYSSQKIEDLQTSLKLVTDDNISIGTPLSIKDNGNVEEVITTPSVASNVTDLNTNYNSLYMCVEKITNTQYIVNRGNAGTGLHLVDINPTTKDWSWTALTGGPIYVMAIHSLGNNKFLFLESNTRSSGSYQISLSIYELSGTTLSQVGTNTVVRSDANPQYRAYIFQCGPREYAVRVYRQANGTFLTSGWQLDAGHTTISFIGSPTTNTNASGQVRSLESPLGVHTISGSYSTIVSAYTTTTLSVGDSTYSGSSWVNSSAASYQIPDGTSPDIKGIFHLRDSLFGIFAEHNNVGVYSYRLYIYDSSQTEIIKEVMLEDGLSSADRIKDKTAWFKQSGYLSYDGEAFNILPNQSGALKFKRIYFDSDSLETVGTLAVSSYTVTNYNDNYGMPITPFENGSDKGLYTWYGNTSGANTFNYRTYPSQNYQRFVGFSDGVYTTGQEVGVKKVGEIAEGLSGLSEGSFYKVSPDGSISPAPITEANIQAVSPTEAIVMSGGTYEKP